MSRTNVRSSKLRLKVFPLAMRFFSDHFNSTLIVVYISDFNPKNLKTGSRRKKNLAQVLHNVPADKGTEPTTP